MLINEVKNLNIDNASIILNINKINILFGDDKTSKFFYILDKGIRPLLNVKENINLDNANKKIIYDNILKELSLSTNEALTSGLNDILDYYINKYEELNIKKYLFLLLEPGLLNKNDSIKAIFQQFDAIKFTYNEQDNGANNRILIDSFEEYIIAQDQDIIKYKKFVFLLLKIIEKIIDTELRVNPLRELYDNFRKIELGEENLDENIKTTKMAYANIKQSLNNAIIIDKIIENINKLNKIPKYRTIGYYINFNGFDTGNEKIGKINLIKMLIFLLYDIDNKNDEFILDETSFATIFNSNNKDDDITNIGNIVDEAYIAVPDGASALAAPGAIAAARDTAAAAASSGRAETAEVELASLGGKKTRRQKSRRKYSKNKTR
jgi:hypothetical protein